MIPTEFQQLKKQYQELASKVTLGDKLLNDMRQLEFLKKRLTSAKTFELLIDSNSYYLDDAGLTLTDIKKVLNDLIDKKHQEYMTQWENL